MQVSPATTRRPLRSTSFRLADLDLASDDRRANAMLRDELRAVRRFFRGKVGPEEVDDLVQRTVTGLLAGARRFEAETSLSSLLAAIARRQLGKFARDHGRHASRHDSGTEVTELDGPSESPCDSYILAEDCARVRTALSCLTNEHREVLELHYWHEIPHPEIAESLGISAVTVRTRLHRARTALQQALRTSGRYEASSARRAALAASDDSSGLAENLGNAGASVGT
jgi:RNA polymerase sigma-70 factor (ECF subfamily)